MIFSPRLNLFLKLLFSENNSTDYPLFLSFKALSNFFDENDLKKIKNDLETISDGRIKVSLRDDGFYLFYPFFDMVFLLLEKGYSYTEISYMLDWRDFERYVANIFRKMGFEIILNFHFSYNRVRREIDILAQIDNILLCIDAKHWKKGMSESKLKFLAAQQKERCIFLAEYIRKCENVGPILSFPLNHTHSIHIFPLIITLYRTKYCVIEKIPIISANLLKQFLTWFDVNKYSLWHISVMTDKSLK
ncbi:MAG: restriction endonuclease [Candidatus Odinarchaeota archaeon]|nr:restriction endonuclease [Candidatus Odinarchaeota archaeon]